MSTVSSIHAKLAKPSTVVDALFQPVNLINQIQIQRIGAMKQNGIEKTERRIVVLTSAEKVQQQHPQH
jgi:hypothetical protein